MGPRRGARSQAGREADRPERQPSQEPGSSSQAANVLAPRTMPYLVERPARAWPSSSVLRTLCLPYIWKGSGEEGRGRDKGGREGAREREGLSDSREWDLAQVSKRAADIWGPAHLVWCCRQGRLPRLPMSVQARRAISLGFGPRRNALPLGQADM